MGNLIRNTNKTTLEEPTFQSPGNEIRLREGFDFKIDINMYRFHFCTKMTLDGLEYYKIESDARSFISFGNLEGFKTLVSDKNQKWSAFIVLCFSEKAKSQNLELYTKDEKEFNTFVTKLSKYIKKI